MKRWVKIFIGAIIAVAMFPAIILIILNRTFPTDVPADSRAAKRTIPDSVRLLRISEACTEPLFSVVMDDCPMGGCREIYSMSIGVEGMKSDRIDQISQSFTDLEPTFDVFISSEESGLLPPCKMISIEFSRPQELGH